MHWSSCLQPQSAAVANEVQLDEFPVPTIRLITINLSLLVFPIECPRKRGALGFHASQCRLHQRHIHQPAQGGHPTALHLPGSGASQPTPSASPRVSAALSASAPHLQPPA